jgi:hypothetical protein
MQRYHSKSFEALCKWGEKGPGDYRIGEGNTLYELRKIAVRGFLYFSLW